MAKETAQQRALRLGRAIPPDRGRNTLVGNRALRRYVATGLAVKVRRTPNGRSDSRHSVDTVVQRRRSGRAFTGSAAIEKEGLRRDAASATRLTRWHVDCHVGRKRWRATRVRRPGRHSHKRIAKKIPFAGACRRASRGGGSVVSYRRRLDVNNVGAHGYERLRANALSLVGSSRVVKVVSRQRPTMRRCINAARAVAC